MPPRSDPPDPCFIYHFTDIANVPGILAAGGLQCKARAEPIRDASYSHIQARRANRIVLLPPGGTLPDYVPFYFGSRSPMLYLISRRNHPTYSGQQQDLVYLVSSVARIQAAGLPFAFTDGHAEMRLSRFFSDPEQLTQIDWEVVRAQYWSQDDERRRKRQAEFLVHHFVPLRAFQGFAVMTASVQAQVEALLREDGSNLPVVTRNHWYY